MKEIKAGETVFVCMRLRFRWYSISMSTAAEDLFLGVLLGVRRGEGYVGERGVGQKLRRNIFHKAS